MNNFTLPPGPLADQVSAIEQDQNISDQEKKWKVDKLLADYVTDHIRQSFPLGSIVGTQEVETATQALTSNVTNMLLNALPPKLKDGCKVTQDPNNPSLYHIEWPLTRVMQLFNVSLRQQEPHSFIEKYFEESQEYPAVAHEAMRLGLWQEYISSTFLNGWINYVKPRKAWLLTRYAQHNLNKQAVEILNNQSDPPHHTNLREIFEDDILLLAQEEEYPTFWWVFWFDNDTSDCCIGRFKSRVSEETIIVDFAAWAQERSLDLSKVYSQNIGLSSNKEGWPALEIDVTKLRGWIRF